MFVICTIQKIWLVAAHYVNNLEKHCVDVQIHALVSELLSATNEMHGTSSEIEKSQRSDANAESCGLQTNLHYTNNKKMLVVEILVSEKYVCNRE